MQHLLPVVLGSRDLQILCTGQSSALFESEHANLLEHESIDYRHDLTYRPPQTAQLAYDQCVTLLQNAALPASSSLS